MKSLLSLGKNYVRKFLKKFGYKVVYIGPYSIFDFESFLYRHISMHKTLTFIQIGANDGVMNDPIYDFNVKNKSVVSGFVLEPLPDIYKKLVKNYERCQNIKAVNIAIHATESEMVLYRVKEDRINDVPLFARGIASFDEGHWKKNSLIPDSSFLEKVEVKCMSFSNFIKSNAVDRLDLLLLDTEGYDFEILMSIDFTKIRPRIIRFEHGIRNLLMSYENFNEVCKHLNSFGYQIIAESYDATAYLLDPADLI